MIREVNADPAREESYLEDADVTRVRLECTGVAAGLPNALAERSTASLLLK
jgi:hypothetical protein